MALRETSRFSQLDAIQDHDFQFARSLADLTKRASSPCSEHLRVGMRSSLHVLHPITRGGRSEQEKGKSCPKTFVGDDIWETETAQTYQKRKDVAEYKSGLGEVCQICMEEKPSASFLIVEGVGIDSATYVGLYGST
ncbi:hypothetical protein O6H91_22G010300 [Diphasiastrum complanatum]|uniref:Uncharacterized protein n=1 Tax=Diphasiastrum complanatum TaxID=34168 RepID=A0ACC2ACN0_DIPCM|nr:hypothetical protein O6H91_22G010300 [Diphasiastrum complanatum]